MRFFASSSFVLFLLHRMDFALPKPILPEDQ